MVIGMIMISNVMMVIIIIVMMTIIIVVIIIMIIDDIKQRWSVCSGKQPGREEQGCKQ